MRSLAATGLSAITMLFVAVWVSAPAAQPASSARAIASSPAFTAQQLSAQPRTAWITNGGDLTNERYSPLTGLTTANVTGLKAVWRTHLNGSGMASRNSAEAQPLFYEGVLYVETGDNDVFALDVDSGAILWTYQGKPEPKSGAPIGWSSRGVGMGDGKIFVSQIDAKLVALDQRTGKVVWSIQAEPWQDGYSITSAPLYYNGLVITGFSGGEMGVRGRVKAFDAATGKLVWTFYTVPGPGEFGHETWPKGDVWKHGGAPVWQTPAVDPQLGLLYFSTGNPGPDYNGGVRAGDNLFSTSIVALDAMTGKYRWHFQQVHHDIWDYDSPNPIVLFDAVANGQPRKGLVQVSKTGWAYILDRVTGRPLIGIQERPVLQEPRQATAATQPYPIGDEIVPHSVDIAPEDFRLINEGRIYTPFWTTPIAAKPASVGGANWPPSSYDPASHLLYVCATDEIGTFQASELAGDDLPKGRFYTAGKISHAASAERGIFAALDVRTNRLVWRRQWRDMCYSGSVVTAGGLVFVGRNDGRLVALDKRSGDQLWDFRTDAGINASASTFEYRGEQFVAVVSGGAVFASNQHGDSVWLFSLKGTLGPVPIAAPQSPMRTAIAANQPATDLAHGKTVFAQACIACHGDTGAGGVGGGADLTASRLSAGDVAAVIAGGRNKMPAFNGILSAADLRDVGAYVRDGLARKGAGS